MGCTNCSKVLNPPKVVGLIAPVNAAHRSQRCHCLFACRCIHSLTLSLKEHLFLMLSNPWTNINPHRNFTFIYMYCQLFYFSPESPPHFWICYRTLSLGKDYNCEPVILSYFLCLLFIFLSVLHVVCCLLFVFYPLYSFHHDPKSLNIDYYNINFSGGISGTKKKNLSNESLCNFTILYLRFWFKCCYKPTRYCYCKSYIVSSLTDIY